MNKKRIALFSCAALVASGIGLNIQNALSDYGIGENSFSLVAVGGSNSGSNSNSNSNSNWNSNTNTGPWGESDSDGNGNNVNPTRYDATDGPCIETRFGEKGDVLTVYANGQTYSETVKEKGIPVNVCYGDYRNCYEGDDMPSCTSHSCPEHTTTWTGS